jgi:hypothetical protein
VSEPIILYIPKRTLRLELWGLKMRVRNRVFRKRRQRQWVAETIAKIEEMKKQWTGKWAG